MKKLQGTLSTRTMSKHNNAIKSAARYMMKVQRPCTVAECYENMTIKRGKLYRTSGRSISLRQLESKVMRHPVFTRYDGKPKTYSCTIEQYSSYFDDDPNFNRYLNEHKKEYAREYYHRRKEENANE